MDTTCQRRPQERRQVVEVQPFRYQVRAQERAVAFGRWKAADVRSILAAGHGVAQPQPAGQALVIELPVTTSRPLEQYSLRALAGKS